jgi:hypothetical protein
MIDIPEGKINRAGAYIVYQGCYLFALGRELYQGRIPVFRIGGHRIECENGWQCAAREAYEETSLQITFLKPSRTYLLPDGDQPNGELEEIAWKTEAENEPIPLLLAAYHREGTTLLSLMYLAQIDCLPTPSNEVSGLVLLERKDIHRLCREAVTLEQYLLSGGKAIFRHEFDRSLSLEPFLQLRLLSRLLAIE